MTTWTLKQIRGTYYVFDESGKDVVGSRVQGEAFRQGMAKAYERRISVVIVVENETPPK